MNSHKGRAIGPKFYGFVAGNLLAFGALCYTGASAVRTLNEKLDHVVAFSSCKLALTGELNTAEAEMFAAQRGLLLYASIQRPDKREESRVKFEEHSAKFRKTLDEIRPLLESEQGRMYWEELSSGFEAWQREFSILQNLAAEGKVNEAVNLASERAVPIHVKLAAQGTEFANLLQEQLRAVAQGAQQEAAGSASLALALLLAALTAGAGGIWAVRLMKARLGHIAVALGAGAEQVASASGQVSSASQALAQGASEQAASLEETSSSAEEVTSMTRKNAENSAAAATVMEQVERRVAEANRTLDGMVASMDEINTSSDKIARIIKVIDEIAFQTNILALNAAVEAARAGEAGMGFAVVADEVRNLAQRCAQAARDTSTLIEESITKSKEGRTRLEQVSSAINGITERATKVKTLVDEVNLGSQEQARGIDQIAKAISQLEQVTQRTAANAEESAAASEEMSSQAALLRSRVNDLHEMIGGPGKTACRPGRPEAPPAKRPAASKPFRLIPGAPNPLNRPGDTPAFTRFQTGKDPFPLDEDFKEF